MATKPKRVMTRQTRPYVNSAFSSESDSDNDNHHKHRSSKKLGNIKHDNKINNRRSCFSRFFHKLSSKLFWWRKREIIIPMAVISDEEIKKKKRKKRRNCCLITLLILLLINLITLDVASFRSPNFTSNNSTNITPLDFKSTMCSTLLGSIPTVDYACNYCWDENSDYNVTTFCYLKTMWDSAFDTNAFIKAGWMQNYTFCTWDGIGCDDSGNIIKIDIKDPVVPKIFDPRISSLKTLKILKLIGNRRYPDNVIPPTLFQMENLEELILGATRLSSPIPNTFDKMKSLKSVQFRLNPQLRDPIPDSIAKTSLQVLVFSGQNLTGVIPDFIGNSETLQKSLVFLELTYNQLTGNIPDSLMNLSSLKGINVHDNQLSGEFPPWFCTDKMKFTNNLVFIEFQVNQFSGSIPRGLANCTQLATINIQANQYTGIIPPELANLKRLTAFLANANQLNGNIPPAFGNIRWLKLLLVRNQLVGAIPPGLCQLDGSTDFFACRLQSNRLTLPESGECGKCEVGGQTTIPAQTPQPTQTPQTPQTSQPAQTSLPTQTPQPAQTPLPTQNVQPAPQDAQPAQSVQPAPQDAQPAQSVQPAPQDAQPAQTSQPVQTPRPSVDPELIVPPVQDPEYVPEQDPEQE